MRRVAIFHIVVLVLACGCSTTQQQPMRSVSQLRDLGEKCLAAGETADALKYLTEASETKPGDPVLEYDLALAYDQRGLQDKAFSHLQAALKIKPDYSEALNTLGKMYAERGQFEAARAAFQKALDDAFYKTPQIAAFNLGMLYEKKGDIERALTYYQQAVKMDQNYATAWLRMGEVCEQLRRNDEARHAYGNAVRLAPGLAEAQLRFGIMSYKAGDMEAAVHSLSRVGEIAPNTDMADEARKWLEKLDGSAITRDLHTQPRSPALSWPAEEGGRRGTALTPGPPAGEGFTPSATHGGMGMRGQGSAESQSWLYAIQVGSFADREKAEELKSRLLDKGYKATVKTLKDPSQGRVFVIRLEPVESLSSATTLITQLGGEVEGTPLIIKVPKKP
ncbi:MAG TPA: tetratricopeptide repeat protein [Syntrophobacteraceae bacterium]|nr:tetratricopeptide repeat protein [Syntrophobacteraceae bacterium]